MKTYVKAVGLACLVVSSTAFADLDFKLQELSPERTGMEYGSKILEFSGKVTGKKWAAENGVGYYFSESDNRYKDSYDRRLSDGYFFNIKKYIHQTEVQDLDDMLARQSQRLGFIEFYNQGSLHFKLVDDDTLEMVPYANTAKERDRLILKRVKEFPENPSPKKLKSAKESGVWFE
ncbi:hypothetical protein [Pseudomonas sp. PA15(2017)]|uniref:hypothetical protein n=1 Tax=Pseudomonas sp. PA15(2017) TaxID=1932111 RepID=UPI00117A3A0D|nr:hypothetical protein [Pseudomonas sp. PA15(2017)]